MAASPSSSPRLPSPPPIAEDQLGPKSPIAMPNERGELGQNPFEANANRRIRPGTKAADMALGPPLVPLTDIDSPFQLTEHLKSLHNAALHRTNSNTLTPIDRATATRLAHPPEGVDKYLWLYELCRLLCKEINSMIVALFQDSPPCSAATCNEMRASEWQYLCAVHDPPKPCCAIDYCCHTLDWTNHVLTSQKNFPSRLTLGEGGGGGQSAHGQLRQLTNIFRRVYRIFAHAWFQHREMYWHVELKSGLYVFFKTVCDVYNLIPEDNYTVPPEAEGLEPVSEPAAKPPSIMKRAQEKEDPEPLLKAPTADAATTKRHRHTPSVGSESITTVLEDPEEEDGEGSKLEETVILSSEPPEYSEQHAELEVGEEPGPVIENLAPADDITPEETSKVAASEEEENEATSVEVPLISTTEPEPELAPEPTLSDAPTTETQAKDPESALKDEADTEAEPEKEAEAGVTVASSTASDTDSQGSWQVLTNEPQTSGSSAEATPASSTTEEIETIEDDAEAETAAPDQAETKDKDEKDEEKAPEHVEKASKDEDEDEDEDEVSKAEETKEASTESTSTQAAEESESKPVAVEETKEDEADLKSEKTTEVEEEDTKPTAEATASTEDDKVTKTKEDEEDEEEAKTKEKAKDDVKTKEPDEAKD